MMADIVLAAELVKDKLDTLIVVADPPKETAPEPDDILRPEVVDVTVPFKIKMPDAPLPP